MSIFSYRTFVMILGANWQQALTTLGGGRDKKKIKLEQERRSVIQIGISGSHFKVVGMSKTWKVQSLRKLVFSNKSYLFEEPSFGSVLSIAHLPTASSHPDVH